MSVSQPPIEVLEDTLGWSSERNYVGWDYSDGMSSKLLRAIPVESRVLNLAFQETAKRSPINVRPLLSIPKRRSFKGVALFILANLAAYDATGERKYVQEASRLGQWLLAQCREQPFGWGHNHRLQTLDGIIPRNTPSIVPVVYGVRALCALDAYRDIPLVEQFPQLVHEFVLEDLCYEHCADGARINYWAEQVEDYHVLNANALGAALLIELATRFDRPDLADLAEPIFSYVASRQTSSGGWYYADPPGASHLSMDNHHNGFILESFLRYRASTANTRFDDVIRTGLEFYERTLHDPNGAPRWDETSRYPRDIHAAAQGIITFEHADRADVSARILEWTLRHLYAGEGRFWYRKDRFYTRRITLMRWSQAWMAMAMAVIVSDSIAEPGPARGLSVPA